MLVSKNLGDWFGPVDKARIEKLIANVRNERIPCKEDKRLCGRLSQLVVEFFRNICIPIAGNSNLSKSGIKCLKIVIIHSNRC